jgi:hypothetical protein
MQAIECHQIKQKTREKIMKWLEIIELRSVDSNRELLESQLQKLTNDLDKETKKQAISVWLS